MSAEQHQLLHNHAHPHYELAPAWFGAARLQTDITEKRPFTLSRVKERFKKYPSVPLFDLYSAYKDIEKLAPEVGKDEAIFRVCLRLIIDMLSLRQEMTGGIDTNTIVTQVYWDKEKEMAVLQNKLYAKGKNLPQMYADSLAGIPEELHDRFEREIKQTIAIFQTLVEEIKPLLTANMLNEESLMQHGFVLRDIEVSASLLSTLPHLRATLSSYEDIKDIVGGKRTLRAYVLPVQTLTLSPPHWSHANGKTSFAWLSELMVFPQTGEVAIVQHGKFSKTKLSSLLAFLAYREPRDQVFHSEQELMERINLILNEAHVSPHVILDAIVKQINSLPKPDDRFITNEKVDPNVAEGVFDFVPFAQTLHELLAFEYDRIQENPDYVRGLKDRLNMITQLNLHQIARKDSTALPAILESYKKNYSDLRRSQKARQQYRFIKLDALAADSGFKLPINLSLLDCSVGSVLSFGQKLGNLTPQEIQAHLELKLGNETLQSLQEWQNKGITSSGDLHAFCSTFGIDASRFHPGKCVVTNKDSHGHLTPCPSTYVGECGVCPICEMKDNLGLLSHDLNDLYLEASPAHPIDSSLESLNLDASLKPHATLGDFAASLTTGRQVYAEAA